MLDGMGFAWNAQEAAWARHFEDLKRYKKAYGDCMVPLSFTEYPQLGLWVKEQRRHYTLLKQGKHSHMTSARISKLESVAFTWDSHEAIWWERYRELSQYREYFGDCLVPTKYSANPKLGTWVHHQRRQYRMMKEGRPSHMTQRRIKALEGIGFNWAPRADRGGGSSLRSRADSSAASSSWAAASLNSSSSLERAAKGKSAAAKDDEGAEERDDDSETEEEVSVASDEELVPGAASNKYNSDSGEEEDEEVDEDEEEEDANGDDDESFDTDENGFIMGKPAGTQARAA